MFVITNSYKPLLTNYNNKPICYQIISMTTTARLNAVIVPNIWLGNSY